MQRRIAGARAARRRDAQAEMEAEIERVRRSFRAELVPLRHTTALVHRPRVRPPV